MDIPEQWEGKTLSLHMGYVDDEDITYFNGIEIGSTKGYTRSRTYEIPGNLVKAGKAVITVRIVDTGGGCGIGGEMKLSKDVICLSIIQKVFNGSVKLPLNLILTQCLR